MQEIRIIVPNLPPKKHKGQSMRGVETEAYRVEVIRHGLDQGLIMLRKGTHSTTKGNTP